ncbi:MAG: phosphate/phosphite/phosphonate ABC transporter substrate-binding protein [Candidatus Thiodiazotropha lotti]|nr:phosphate/phosphite/phosphonate ABC transporter substrate-binding protein [Candidatus Thiodiazotropha lotti]MCW4190497.1 phosphate/phosphite/phosphonate ABC transporter substrate-binding protein [Candidatus Thiodiazotropha weberae]
MEHIAETNHLVRYARQAIVVLLLVCCEFLNSALADPLVVGIFPRRDAAVTAKLFRPLTQHLEKQLDRQVRLELSPTFDVFLKRLKERRYDLVHLNQFEYINANKELGYIVIAQNEEFGERTIRGAIFVRKDSGISDINQLKEKKILFGGGPRAMMSYIVPTYLLRQRGLKERDYSEIYASNPPNAVLATFQKQADAGGAGEVVARLPLVKNKIDVSELTTLAVSKPLPHLPWAVKQEMDEDLKSKITDLLLGLKNSAEGKNILKSARLSAINPASDAEYDSHRVIIDFVYAN